MTAPLSFLICPLDWGLGHAARCVPLIRSLLNRSHRVVIAADRRPLAFLQSEFPDLETIRLPGVNVTYPGSGWMTLKLLMQAPNLLLGVRRECRLLERLVRRHKFDVVISDNRFGLFTRRARCVYVTHQLWIPCPPRLKWLEPLLHQAHRRILARYDECWIPDFPGGRNLSGELSHRAGLPANARFIGPLSRFRLSSASEAGAGCDLLAILSGPEPQRTIFQKMIREQAGTVTGRVLIVEGKPDDAAGRRRLGNLEIVPHLPTAELQRELTAARAILSRPGYSTLMDLAALGRNAILVPTPGQTEQEYLARRATGLGWCHSQAQKGFNLEAALAGLEKLSAPPRLPDGADLLQERLTALERSLTPKPTANRPSAVTGQTRVP